jgi:prefoldin subunit 5
VDGDLARLQILLAKKQEYVAILELELTNTRADLNSFTQVYNQRIAPLHRRANHLRKMLYEELEKQRENDKDKWPEFPGAGGAAGNGDNDAPFPDNKKQKGHTGQKMNGGALNGMEDRRDPKREEQIRDLFRKLAKRFHPDLTADPDEKIKREQIMAQVNLAYTARDLEALIKLDETPDIARVNGSLSQAKQIAQLRAELKRLDLVITELETTIRQIDTSPIMQLRLETHMARRDGKELLVDMSTDLEVQIKDLEEHLIVLGVEIEGEPLA